MKQPKLEDQSDKDDVKEEYSMPILKASSLLISLQDMQRFLLYHGKMGHLAQNDSIMKTLREFCDSNLKQTDICSYTF